MRKVTKLLAASCISFVSFSCVAQEDEGPAGFSYVTYYNCAQSTQGAMDTIVETNEKPVLDKWVKEGKLIAWGYLSHFTGGSWRRAMYHVSATMADALNNQSAIFTEIYSDNPAGGQARAAACASHDDYVWALGQGSGPGTDRGDVSLSVYFVCAVADEERADEIFASTYAPKLDQLQKDGKIASWGWQMHRIGGRYRRLQTVTGADYATVTAARGEVFQHVNQNHADLGREFSQICGSHSDYIWDIVHEAP
jgi:hypothetical protein